MRMRASVLIQALAVAGFLAIVHGQSPSAPNPYRVVDGWAQLPKEIEWAQVSGVELDRHGNLWVIQRGSPSIFELGPDGRVMESIDLALVQPHSLHFDRDGSLWVVDGDVKDGKGGQVLKIRTDGGFVLLALGKPGGAGDGADTFNRPADVATARNGDIFVADGHVNARIVKFDKKGRYLKSWGTKGSGPGQLDTPHAIAIDAKGRVLVGDRGNNRIEIFDQNGEYLDEWKQFGRPTGLFVAPDNTLYVADDESNDQRNPGWTPGIRIGSANHGKLIANIPAMSTERAVADRAGNIYAAVLAGKTVRKYEKADR